MTEKEKNKLIERTAKRDAYSMVYNWAKGTNKSLEFGSPAWYAKVKMDSHTSWLEKQPYIYDYATSSFIGREIK